MNSLSQAEWHKYVDYALYGDKLEQRLRVFGILLENFEWDWYRSDDIDYCNKMRQREADINYLKFQLSLKDEKKVNKIYNNRCPWGKKGI